MRIEARERPAPSRGVSVRFYVRGSHIKTRGIAIICSWRICSSKEDLWVCPYWNSSLRAICFRIRGTEKDLEYRLEEKTLGNIGRRAFARLAVEEGHIATFVGTSNSWLGLSALLIRFHNKKHRWREGRVT